MMCKSAAQVWVTEYQRTQQTGRHLAGPLRVVPELGEIRAGAHDGLTYEQIAEQFPVEFALRDEDKLRYRYPGGESYLDVVQVYFYSPHSSAPSLQHFFIGLASPQPSTEDRASSGGAEEE